MRIERVTSRLTVNYGIRLEHETGLAERNNQLAVGFGRLVLSAAAVPREVATPAGPFLSLRRRERCAASIRQCRNQVFGLFRLAVIAQQIYYRYFHGQTHNEAYAEFGVGARYFEGRCLALIDA